jgi:hypothetical protein
MSDKQTKYAEVPSACPGCKKGTPELRGHTDDLGEPLTWWHCPSCETTGVKRLPENETKIEKGEGSGDEHLLTKTHPQAFEIFNALSEAKKLKGAFDLIKAKVIAKKIPFAPNSDLRIPHPDDKASRSLLSEPRNQGNESNRSNREMKRQHAANISAPVKVFTDEEKRALEVKMKKGEEEPHDDKNHEKKEKKAASKIKRSAQQILDLHKEKK